MSKPINRHTPVPGTEVTPSHRRSAQDHYLDDCGREVLSPLPVAPPVGYVKHISLAEQIRAMVRSEALRYHAETSGHETFEEADDFDCGDDFDPRSPYEVDFEPPAVEAIRRRVEAEKASAATTPPATPKKGVKGASKPQERAIDDED